MPAAVLALALLTTACGCASRGPAWSPTGDAELRSSIRGLPACYARNDQACVVSTLDPQGFIVYGTDANEIVDTEQELRQLMDDDFRLWSTAAFGELQDLDIRGSAGLASAYFHVPFSAGGRPPLLVRFSTTWRKARGKWYLAQSANTVPTTGMSASELIRRSK